MAFQITDFKKTARRTGDTRLIYPYQIRDDRYTAALSYAIDYYERMLGCERSRFEAETLLEFFGDPRLARGLVACLARSYVWHTRSIAELLGEPVAYALRARGIASPADARRRLYGLANGRYGGVILPEERQEALEYLCSSLAEEPAEPQVNLPALRISAAQFEQILDLDSELKHILVKRSAKPDAESIIASYNFHSLETALRRVEWIKLEFKASPLWSLLRSVYRLSQRYRLRYEIEGGPRTLFDTRMQLTIHSERSVLGDWVRTGKRIVQMLLRLMAAHPGALVSGEACVNIDGQRATLRLDTRTLATLGAMAAEAEQSEDAWEQTLFDDFRKAWSQRQASPRGWRLQSDPEPLISPGTLVIPDFVVQQRSTRVALCLAQTQRSAESLMRDLGQLRAHPAIVITQAAIAEQLRSCPVPLVTYENEVREALPGLLSLLERRYLVAA